MYNPGELFTRGTDGLRDGMLFRDKELGKIFMTIGGGRFEMEADEVAALGGDAEPLPSSVIRALPTVPQRPVTVRTNDGTDVFLVSGGIKKIVTGSTNLLPASEAAILLVPRSLLASVPQRG